MAYQEGEAGKGEETNPSYPPTEEGSQDSHYILEIVIIWNEKGEDEKRCLTRTYYSARKKRSGKKIELRFTADGQKKLSEGSRKAFGV